MEASDELAVFDTARASWARDGPSEPARTSFRSFALGRHDHRRFSSCSAVSSCIVKVLSVLERGIRIQGTWY